jgi:hypothetical protein
LAGRIETRSQTCQRISDISPKYFEPRADLVCGALADAEELEQLVKVLLIGAEDRKGRHVLDDGPFRIRLFLREVEEEVFAVDLRVLSQGVNNRDRDKEKERERAYGVEEDFAVVLESHPLHSRVVDALRKQ